MTIEEAIQIAKERLGLQYFQHLQISFKKVDDPLSISLKRNGNNVAIEYGQLATLFRCLTLVKERHEESEYEIAGSKRFVHDGYMIDCSRNGVVKLDQLKEFVLMLALMGENRLMLYTEDTYKLDNYPWFGYLRGGYTKEDIKEIVAYGEAFGVELVPCIQTLGHLERPLHWEQMIPLRDGSSTLLAGEEPVYKFIEEMIKFCRECFKSKAIHIGMDESTEMGLGRYLEKHPYTDRVELFSKHLNRVINICSKYEFTPMIWSDMYFRLNSENGDYYRDTPLPESTLRLIPPGVELVYWDYYHTEKTTYDMMFEYHQQTKNPVSFAGGAWRWKGFAPSIQGSFKRMVLALESALEHGIDSFITTGWGDNGNECSIFAVLPVLALDSTMDYFGASDDKTVSSLLEAVTGEPLDRMRLMDIPDTPDKKVLIAQYNPSKFFLYQDVMNGLFEGQVKPHYAANYAEFANTLLEASKKSERYGYVYKTLGLLCDALSIKVDLGTRLRSVYKKGDKEALAKIVGNDIPALITKLDALNSAHREQWYKENRPFGFDIVDGRNGFLKNRVLSAKIQVESYLKGEVDKLEELETEILPFNGHDYEICWNWWATTVSVNGI